MIKTSTLDWHRAPLTPFTRIDSAYKNTENVRRFFKKEIGEHFNFTRDFMQYIKANTGITLREAGTYWKKMNVEK